MFKNTSTFSSFSVPDIEKAKDFYSTVLGLDVKERPEGLEIHLQGGAHVFVYHSEEYTAPECTILNFLVEDIYKCVEELKMRGVSMEQYDLPQMKTDEKGIVNNDSGFGPKAMAWFKDPADHILSVIQEK